MNMLYSNQNQTISINSEMTYTKRVIPITDEDVFRVGGTFYGDNSSDEYGFEEDNIYWLNNKCSSLALKFLIF